MVELTIILNGITHKPLPCEPQDIDTLKIRYQATEVDVMARPPKKMNVSIGRNTYEYLLNHTKEEGSFTLNGKHCWFINASVFGDNTYVGCCGCDDDVTKEKIVAWWWREKPGTVSSQSYCRNCLDKLIKDPRYDALIAKLVEKDLING